MTPDQQEQYLKWLDEEIIEQRRAKELKDRKHFDFHEGVEIGCIAAKEKFMELINPQSINNDQAGTPR